MKIMLGKVNAGATVSPSTSLGGIEFRCRFPVYAFVFSHYHLSDAFSVLNHKSFLAMVDEEHFDFSPIIGIDGAGAI